MHLLMTSLPVSLVYSTPWIRFQFQSAVEKLYLGNIFNVVKIQIQQFQPEHKWQEMTWWRITWSGWVTYWSGSTWWGSRGPLAKSGDCFPQLWESWALPEPECSQPGCPDGYRPGAGTPTGFEDVADIWVNSSWCCWWTYQSFHVVDTTWDVSDEIVTQVQLLQLGQVGERCRQCGQLVVGQTQYLSDRNVHPSRFSSADEILSVAFIVPPVLYRLQVLQEPQSVCFCRQIKLWASWAVQVLQAGCSATHRTTASTEALWKGSRFHDSDTYSSIY